MPDVIDELTSSLADAGIADARREAEQLLRAANGEPARARAMVDARRGGTPLAYLTGRVSFLGVELEVAPGALVPRTETELLGRTAIELLSASASASPRVLDVCCGAGNLACAIAAHVPTALVWASDSTREAVQLARRNAARVGSSRITVTEGDLFEPLRGLEERFDLVLANPPYISTARLAGDRAHLLAHEPREAFDGGPYGIAIHQRLVREGLAFVHPGGVLALELGRGQERQVTRLAQRARGWDDVVIIEDPASDGRVALLRRSRRPTTKEES